MIDDLTSEQDAYLRQRQSEAYYDGLREGVRMYAHWKNGVQYVDTTGKTLGEALAEIQRQKDEIKARS